MKILRRICNSKEILLIFDEVQTGFGRTGHLFAYERYGVKPDIITLAKALGGGVAIGAIGGTKRVIESFAPGTHAATFGGNPLACSAGLASLNVLLERGFLENSRKMGDYFFSELGKLKARFSSIKSVRGVGLMLAAELNQPGRSIILNCMRQGVLINCIQENILRFLPPLTVTQKEIDCVIKVLTHNLKTV